MKPNLVTITRHPFRVRGLLSRTAALMACLAISACTVGRLAAVVIDDFENGVKFAAGGGGTNYFVWGVTNGQLVISKQNPIPTPPGSVLTTYDSVYWPPPYPKFLYRDEELIFLRRAGCASRRVSRAAESKTAVV